MALLTSLSSVPWVEILGALVVLLTAVHTFFLFVGKFWAPALKVAELTGVVAVDVQQVLQWFGGAKISKAASSVGPMLLVLFAASFLFGCAGSFEEARGPRIVLTGGSPAVATTAAQRCQKLDDDHAKLSAAAVGWGFIGGASGITAIPMKSDGLRTGFEITAVASAALALAAGALAQSDATEWAKECSGP